jgi:hypothetical protein
LLSRGEQEWGANFKKILIFPPFITYSSLFVRMYLVLILIGYSLFCRKWEVELLHSLVSVGLQLRFESQSALEILGLGLFLN